MQSQERAFAILRTLGGHGGLSLTEVATQVALPKPTVLRFLRSLEQGAWVSRADDGSYRLGPAVLGLAGQYLSSDTMLVVAAQPMKRLRDSLGETITLSRASTTTRTCVLEFQSTQPLRLVLGLGDTSPLHAGASALVLLAHMPASAREAVIASGPARITARTLTMADDLERACDQIRSQGFSVTRGQRTEGAVAASVAVDDPGAKWGVSALGVYGPESRCRSIDDERRWVDALTACADEIRAAMSGARGEPASRSATT